MCNKILITTLLSLFLLLFVLCAVSAEFEPMTLLPSVVIEMTMV